MTAIANTTFDAMPSIEDLYRDYAPMVRRRAWSVLGDENAADDAVQEVFTKVIRTSDGFQAKASPKTWLYRVTTNYCLNVKRDSARRRRLLEQKVFPATTRSGGSLEPRVQVSSLLKSMPPEVRDVASCFYLAGMTQDETADKLNISRRTVGNRLKIFRDTARAALSA